MGVEANVLCLLVRVLISEQGAQVWKFKVRPGTAAKIRRSSLGHLISPRILSGYGAGEARCRDCQLDLEPDSAQSDGRTEYAYMVCHQVWKQAGMPADGQRALLCVGCLERRLGRELVADDFLPGYPGNWPLAQDTPRLAARKALIVRPADADFWAEMQAAQAAAAQEPAEGLAAGVLAAPEGPVLSGLRLPPMTRRKRPKPKR